MAAEVSPDGELDPRIIVGYGRVGQVMGDMRDRHGIPIIAMDAIAEVTSRAGFTASRSIAGDGHPRLSRAMRPHHRPR